MIFTVEHDLHSWFPTSLRIAGHQIWSWAMTIKYDAYLMNQTGFWMVIWWLLTGDALPNDLCVVSPSMEPGQAAAFKSWWLHRSAEKIRSWFWKPSRRMWDPCSLHHRSSGLDWIRRLAVFFCSGFGIFGCFWSPKSTCLQWLDSLVTRHWRPNPNFGSHSGFRFRRKVWNPIHRVSQVSNWSNDIHVPEPLHETHQELLSNKDFAMEAIEINGLQGQEWRFTIQAQDFLGFSVPKLVCWRISTGDHDMSKSNRSLTEIADEITPSLKMGRVFQSSWGTFLWNGCVWK